MPSLRYNPKDLKYYGASTDSVPDGLQVGDKAYFFDTTPPQNVVWNGTVFVDDVINTDTVSQDKLATFHNAVVATGNGTTVTVDGFKTLTLSCSGTNTSRTIEVHAIDSNSVDNIIPGFSVVDLSQHNTLTSKDLSLYYSVDGMVSVYAKITALSGGNATIKGKLTA